MNDKTQQRIDELKEQNSRLLKELVDPLLFFFRHLFSAFLN